MANTLFMLMVDSYNKIMVTFKVEIHNLVGIDYIEDTFDLMGKTYNCY